MKVQIQRLRTSDKGTPGVVFVGGVRQCCSIELPWRDNLSCKSCIPAGMYSVVPYSSKKFGRVFWIKEVPERLAILFHSGNLAGNREVGYKAQSLGCILLGKYFGKYEGQEAVWVSKRAVAEFKTAVGDKQFELEIVNLF